MFTFKDFLAEVKLQRDDPDFDDYYDDRMRDEQNTADAPYAVGWSGQSWEWYGDLENPGKGSGRYKMKGDGGQFVAINVPDFETAQQIENKLEDDYKQHKFYDESVYSKYGEDGYGVDWHGAFIIPMKDVRDSWRFKYDKPKDYSQEQAA